MEPQTLAIRRPLTSLVHRSQSHAHFVPVGDLVVRLLGEAVKGFEPSETKGREGVSGVPQVTLSPIPSNGCGAD